MNYLTTDLFLIDPIQVQMKVFAHQLLSTMKLTVDILVSFFFSSGGCDFVFSETKPVSFIFVIQLIITTYLYQQYVKLYYVYWQIFILSCSDFILLRYFYNRK